MWKGRKKEKKKKNSVRSEIMCYLVQQQKIMCFQPAMTEREVPLVIKVNLGLKLKNIH